MRILYLQHISFEGLGSMENFFVAKGSQLSRTCMYADQSLPSIHEIDALIIMGGPMGVYDEAQYPWLVLEKEFIESVVQRKIPVFGVCLGAQLIASVLGASVQKNHQEEIGWFPVERKLNTPFAMLDKFPQQFDALHWHSDTFAIPSGADNFLQTAGCANQGFIYDQHVLALQFHLEMLPSNVQTIYQECGNQDKEGEYIQGLDAMLAPAEKFQQASRTLEQVLEAFIFQ